MPLRNLFHVIKNEILQSWWLMLSSGTGLTSVERPYRNKKCIWLISYRIPPYWYIWQFSFFSGNPNLIIPTDTSEGRFTVRKVYSPKKKSSSGKLLIPAYNSKGKKIFTVFYDNAFESYHGNIFVTCLEHSQNTFNSYHNTTYCLSNSPNQ